MRIKATQMTTRPSKGFSLLELMIAIAVVGIITSIAVPYFGDQVHKARVAQAVADILKIAQALEVHYMENDVYPDSLNAIDGPGISLTDPWDRAYRYLNIGSQKGNGVYRKNGALVPINTAARVEQPQAGCIEDVDSVVGSNNHDGAP